mgnify:CR=1 FL=1
MPIVTVKTKGVAKFGRAGLRFSDTPITVEVSEEQLVILKGEAMLDVSDGGGVAAKVPAPKVERSEEDTDHGVKRKAGGRR